MCVTPSVPYENLLNTKVHESSRTSTKISAITVGLFFRLALEINARGG